MRERRRVSRNQRKSERARARRRRAQRGRRFVDALVGGALALPSVVAPAQADTPIEQAASDYSFRFYAEEPLASSKSAAGNTTRDRYEIQMHQFHIESPLTARSDLSADVVYETMSGASPWFVQNQGGRPVQVMSGASIEEQRTDALISGNYYFDRAKLGASAGISTENDYFSWNLGASGELSFDDKNTTLSLGVGFSDDRIEPTDAVAFNRIESAKKNSYSANIGLTRVLGRKSVIQTSFSYRFNNGYLSDPYKLAEVNGANRADNRPDQRHQFAWLTRYRRHYESLDASLHLDYRYAFDDWQLTSHTLEAAWYQSLFRVLRIIPNVRWYSQSQADFYSPFYASAPADGFVSSDYRLSPYGAISYGVKAEVDLEDWPGRFDWRLNAGWDRYVSDSDFAAKKVSVESPGLVGFDLFSVQLQGRF
jgi:hypothetical protein